MVEKQEPFDVEAAHVTQCHNSLQRTREMWQQHGDSHSSCCIELIPYFWSFRYLIMVPSCLHITCTGARMLVEGSWRGFCCSVRPLSLKWHVWGP